MANTIFDAEISGSYAGMEPAKPREVPPPYKHHPVLAAAWLESYDRTVTSQQCQRPNVMEAPAKAERHAEDKEDAGPKRPKAAAVIPANVRVPEKPTMRAILEGSISERL